MTAPTTAAEYAAWREQRRADLVAKWSTTDPTPAATAACQRLGRLLGGGR
jgi:hypothetical protein